ncbi:MAG: L-erythro-3,5-diaminohexanoate dehydrogenase [Ornithinimicrobium sp.]
MPIGSPFGLHRVLGTETSVLPQQAWQLDATPALLSTDEVLIDVEALHLDAASYRQLAEKHTLVGGGTAVPGSVNGDAVRAEVLAIITERGKMQNPITGSGGMLIGRVAEVGEASTLGLKVGEPVATLVSLSLTPLQVTDGLRRWDGLSDHVPTHGHAILFGRSIAAALPSDLDPELALMVMDVCGAPALVQRIVTHFSEAHGNPPTVCVLGGAGKSGVLSLASAGRAGALNRIGVVRDAREAALLREAEVAEQVVIADATDPIELANAVQHAGGPADITVVCVDAPGCEQPAIMATAAGGTVIFFSMATHFAAAALGAEGLAADVTMLIGNGYTPGHAEFALDLLRSTPGVRAVFESRLTSTQTTEL